MSHPPHRHPDTPRRRGQAPPSTDAGLAGPALDTLDLYRLLVEQVRDYAIFALDPAGHILSWNAGAQRFKGYAADEIIGRHFSVFYTAPDLAVDFPAYELEVASREGRFEGEGWRVRRDGSVFWANVVITALRDPEGFAKVTRDLTERRAAEQRALEDARRLFRNPADRDTRYVVALAADPAPGAGFRWGAP